MHYLEGRGGPFDGVFGGSDEDAEEVGGGGEAGYEQCDARRGRPSRLKRGAAPRGHESYRSELQRKEARPLRKAKRQGRRKASSGARARMARKARQKRRLVASSSRAGASAGSLRPEVPFVQANQEPSGLSENVVLASG